MNGSGDVTAGMGYVPHVVLAGYLLLLLGLGWLGYRRSKGGEEDYYLAGRQQGWLVSALTIMATFFSSFALLGAPGMVYREGVVFALFSLNVPVAGLCVYLFGSRIWRIGRTKGYVTPADMVADYYGSGPTLRLLVTFTGFLYAIPYVMMQIKAGGDVSAVLFDQYRWAFHWGAVILAIITTVYIMIGGMRSVAWTDVLQGVLLMSGMLIGGIAMVVSFGGLAAFGEAVSNLPERSLSIPGTTGFWHWPMLLTVCLLASSGSMVQPAQWMRYYSVRNREALRRSALVFAIVLPSCFLFGIMLIGLGGQVLYPIQVSAEGATAHPDVGAFDRILVVVLKNQLPELLGQFGLILASVVIVAIMAAAMSTADSNLHALSGILVRDVYDRYVDPEASQRRRVWVGRGVIVAATLVSLAFVLAAEPPGSAQRRDSGAASGEAAPAAASPAEPEAVARRAADFMKMIALLGLLAIAFSAQLLPITIDMLYLRRGTAAGATVGLAAGLATVFVFGPLYLPLVKSLVTAFPQEEFARIRAEAPFAEFAASRQAGDALLVQLAFLIEGCKKAVPIHSSAWGLVVNVPLFVLVSIFTRKIPAERRAQFAALMGVPVADESPAPESKSSPPT